MRIAVVGATVDGDPREVEQLVGEVTRWDPHVVVLTGEYVPRGSRAAWRDFRDAWTTVGDRLVLAPDRSSRRGDRSLSRWRHRGGGVPDLSGSTWSSGTLSSAGSRWRVIVLDSERGALGPGWLDQQTWLPKALAADDPYDQLLVVTGRPLASLQVEPRAGSRATRDLIEAVRENAAPGALRAVVSGGTRTNEFLLHAGPFGEAHVIAGNALSPPGALARHGASSFESVGEMALASGFDEALRGAWLGRIGPPPPDVYGPELPIRGWWQLELDGAELAATFLVAGTDGSEAIYRARTTRAHGWVHEETR